MESVLSRTQEMMVNFWKFFPSNRKRTGFIVILILAAAVPLTVIVSQKQQETRQRASEASRIEITGANVANGTATSRNVKLRLTYVPVVSPTEAPTVVPSVSPEVTISTTVTPETTLTVSPSEIPPTATSIPPTATTAPSPTITPTGQPVQTSPTVTQYGSNCQALYIKIVDGMNKSCDQPGYDPVADVNTTKDRIINQRDLDIFNSRVKYSTAEEWCQTALANTTSPCVQGVATAQEASTTVQFRVSNDQGTLEQAQIQSFAPEELASSPITKEIDWQLTEGNGQKTVFAQFKFGDAAWESVLSTTVSLNEGIGSTSVTHKILTLVIKFRNNQLSPTFSSEEQIRYLERGLFTNSDSVKAFFEQNTKPDLGSPPAVTLENNGIYYIEIPTDEPTNCHEASINEILDQASRANNIDVPSFIQNQNNHLIYYFFGALGCSYGGWARDNKMFQLGMSLGWDNSEMDQMDKKVIAHELVHTLKVDHVNILNCGTPNRIGNFSECRAGPAGERSDIMVHGRENENLYSFVAPIRVQQGWIRPERILEVRESGTYTLKRLGSSEEGYQVLKIRRPNDSTTAPANAGSIFDYYISLRNTEGIDTLLPEDYKTGISIHLEDLTTEGRQNMRLPFILSQVRDSSGNYKFGGLQEGETFTDTLDPGLRISHKLSSDGKSTDVTITFGINNVSATLIPTSTPEPSRVSCGCADLNGDGVITMPDYSFLVAQTCWGKSEVNNSSEWVANSCVNRDINGDRVIDTNDYTCLQEQWQQSCRR